MDGCLERPFFFFSEEWKSCKHPEIEREKRIEEGGRRRKEQRAHMIYIYTYLPTYLSLPRLLPICPVLSY